MSDQKPLGKNETIAALLDAADFLFGEKGPSGVSVREVSVRANVNHGLLHRHFGSKEALLSAIIERHMLAIKAGIQGAGEVDEAVSSLLENLLARPAFTRIFAHLILDHRPVEQFARKTGGTADLAALLNRSGIESEEARKFAAIVMSFALGWVLFKDFAVYAASCEASESELSESVRKLLGAVKQVLPKEGDPK